MECLEECQEDSLEVPVDSLEVLVDSQEVLVPVLVQAERQNLTTSINTICY